MPYFACFFECQYLPWQVSRRQLKAIPLRRYTAILVLSEKALETQTASKDSISTAAIVLVRDILERDSHSNSNSFSMTPDDIPSEERLAYADAFPARHVEEPQGSEAPQDNDGDEQYNVLQAIKAGLGQTIDLVSSPIDLYFDDRSRSGFGMYMPRLNYTSSTLADDLDKLPTVDDSVRYVSDARDNSFVPPPPEDTTLVRDQRATHEASMPHRHTDRRRPSLTRTKAGVKLPFPGKIPRHGARLKRELSLMRDPSTNRKSRPPPVLICELLDSRMSSTLDRFCDVVASNDFMSRILAMVAESAEINATISQLLDASNATLMVLPANIYLEDGETLSFQQLSLRLQECGDILIGYFSITTEDNEDVVINPRDKSSPISWSSRDRLAVIGTDKQRSTHRTIDANEEPHENSSERAVS